MNFLNSFSSSNTPFNFFIAFMIILLWYPDIISFITQLASLNFNLSFGNQLRLIPLPCGKFATKSWVNSMLFLWSHRPITPDFYRYEFPKVTYFKPWNFHSSVLNKVSINSTLIVFTFAVSKLFVSEILFPVLRCYKSQFLHLSQGHDTLTKWSIPALEV